MYKCVMWEVPRVNVIHHPFHWTRLSISLHNTAGNDLWLFVNDPSTRLCVPSVSIFTHHRGPTSKKFEQFINSALTLLTLIHILKELHFLLKYNEYFWLLTYNILRVCHAALVIWTKMLCGVHPLPVHTHFMAHSLLIPLFLPLPFFLTILFFTDH